MSFSSEDASSNYLLIKKSLRRKKPLIELLKIRTQLKSYKRIEE